MATWTFIEVEVVEEAGGVVVVVAVAVVEKVGIL
jgi:hypothetical protein